MGGSNRGAAAGCHGDRAVAPASQGWAHHIDAGSCQLRFYDAGGSEAAAGMDVDAVVQVVVCPHCNGGCGISGQGNGGVGGGTQKYGFIRYQSFRGQPHMKFACKILGIIDPHLPYAGHRIFKTHEYQLFSGAGFNELVINRDDGWLQKKRDRGFIPGYNRNAGDGFPAWRDESHGIGVGSGSPQLQGKTPPGFLRSHPDFHVVPFASGRNGAEIVVGAACLVACGNDRGPAKEPAGILDNAA